MNLAEAINVVEHSQTWKKECDPTRQSSIVEATDIVLKAAKAAQKLFAQEPTKPTKK